MVKALIAAVAVLGLVGCSGGPKENAGGFLGGAGGAIAGAQFGSGTGTLVGVAAGTLLGAILGSEVGRSLDRADSAYYGRHPHPYHYRYHADGYYVVYPAYPVARTVRWREYTPYPVYHYQLHPNGGYWHPSFGSWCQDFRQTVIINGYPRLTYHTACQMPDGNWQIM